MSGFEIAGVVLGALPLVIPALHNYQTGKGVMATMFKFRGLLDKLIRQHRSQQVFFYGKIPILLREAQITDVADMIDSTEVNASKSCKLVKSVTTSRIILAMLDIESL
jgi:hypothetical protein